MGKKPTKKTRKLRKSGKRIIFLLFAVVFFIAVLIGTTFGDWMQIMENRSQTKELTTYKQLLLEEEESLKSEVTKLHDPEYIARYARENQMYTKDGEIILRIVDGKLVQETE